METQSRTSSLPIPTHAPFESSYGFSSRALLRRNWLRTVAAASCCTLFQHHLCGAVKPEVHRLRFGLVTYLWGQHMDLNELLRACETAGLLGVELRTQHQHAVEPELSPAERAEVRRRFADSPVELVGYGSNCEFHSSDPGRLKSNIDQCKQYVRLMHDCGGSGVKVKPNGFSKDVPRQKTIQQIGESLNEVAEYAQGYGQQIRVEVHGAGTSELPVIRDIFRVAEHPNVAVCWNSNSEDLQGDGLQANFEMVKDRFGYTAHVRELDDGNYPYQELLQLFVGIKYDGWILLEARTNPSDKIQAMIEQRELFDRIVEQATSTSGK